MTDSSHSAHGGAGPEGAAVGVRFLADLAARLARLEDAESLQKTALDRAQALFRCRSAALWHWGPGTERLRPGRAVGALVGVDLQGLADVPAVWQTVIRGRKPLVIGPADVPLRVSEVDLGIRAVVPIVGADDLLGMLVVSDVLADEVYDACDRALMIAFGNLVAMATETSLVHAEFRQQMERRMSEVTADLHAASAELARIKTCRFEELIASVPIGIVVFDREFGVTFSNPVAQGLWGRGHNVLDAIARTTVSRLDPEWESGMHEVVDMQRPWRAEAVSLKTPTHETVEVNLVCSPLMSHREGVLGGVLIIEDVTQRLRMQERLEVSERLAGVGRLAAMVAHEINNPLDGIQRLVNLSQRAAGEGQPERVGPYLERVGTGLERIGTIVRDLLDFSRSAGGAVEPMPIPRILTEAVRTMQPAADEAGVTVTVACDGDLSPLKSGHLYHAVLNLVKNAVEATGDGGAVTVSARCNGDALVIEVTDTGPGIPEEALPRLFEPFYSGKAMGKGTGLGLVISRDLVEKQGGTLSAENRPQGGARFTIRVPLASSRPGG